jgi:hypothetical protein
VWGGWGCTGRVGTIRGSSVAYLVVKGSESIGPDLGN